MKPELRFDRPHVEGETFRRMKVVETNGIYRFQHKGDFLIHYEFDVFPDDRVVSFRDEKDREWMRMDRRSKIIRDGYAWNGNSWKRGIRLFGRDIWLGVPDHHPGTLEASDNHDTDFQFCHCEHFPFSFTQANQHYLALAKANNFSSAEVFHNVLVHAGMAAWKSAGKNTVHSVIL